MTMISQHFTQSEDIEPIVVEWIRRARRSIRLMGYGFTSQGIADALKYAVTQHVDVRIILDGPNEHQAASKGRECSDAGITVAYDYEHAIMHDKIIIVDRHVVITGSYNWTEGARRRNAENIVVIEDLATAHAYTENWEMHEGHSLPPGIRKPKLGDEFFTQTYGDAEPIE